MLIGPGSSRSVATRRLQGAPGLSVMKREGPPQSEGAIAMSVREAVELRRARAHGC